MDHPPKEPIAIVGIGCRLPGNVGSAADLHALLTERRSAIVDVPADRWDAAALFHPDFTKPAHIHARRGGFLSGVDQFDAAFFGIAPNEAKRMDPQQRLVLETAYEALEDAGARLEDLAGRPIAVVMGCSGCDYDAILGAPTERANINGTTNTGLASSIVSNRVSYLFDLRGPSFTVDTACSSSLTALHHACRAIWEGAAEGALAGGVNLMLKPSTTIGFSKGAYLSPDAECRAFSDHANGYVRSEGAGVVFLKPLSKARADGDRIHALIRGTWINQDGKTPGMTMPSAAAQEALLRGAYADAGVDPADVAYVEAHGTGTPAGDPIEANAIGKVVGQARRGPAPLPMGSVKTNVGHLESAAGMAGLIKLVLTLKHRTVFPNLHFRAANPKIALADLKLTIPTAPMALPADGSLYGGVNSFGFGGANAHAVLESPPAELPPRRPEAAARPHALFLSARSAAALKAMAGTVKADPALCGAYSRQKSRFEFRLAVVGETAEELAAGLKAFVDGKESPAVFTRRAAEGSKEKVAFVFSGQGGQHWQMGRQLFAHEPLFRQTVEQIDGLLKKLGWGDLIAELHRDEASSRMGETQVAQPALFALEVGVAKLLMAHGVTPVAMVGHSIGELAAAHLSGALSLEEATRIVFWRSRCQAQAENKGAMAAIGLPQAEVEKLLQPYGGKIEVAAINGPAAITVAGDTAEVERLVASLDAKSVFAQRLNVSVPFHCRLMDPIEGDFRRRLGRIATAATTTPYYSTVTGGQLDGAGLDLDYWFQNIRAPVRYLPAFQQLLADGVTCFVEIGPTAALRTGSTDAIAKAGARATYLGTLRQKGDERQLMMKAVAQLFTAGAAVSAEPLTTPHAFVPLPPHPFERQSHWLETAAGRAKRFAPAPHPHVEAIETRVKSRDLFAATIALDARVDRYLADHKVQGLLVFPGAGQLEVVQAAAAKALGSPDVFLEGVEFRLPMVLDDGDAATRFALEVYSDEGHFQIASARDGQFTEHTRGRIQHGADRFAPRTIDLAAVRARVQRQIPLDALFRESAAAGLDLGPAFRGIREFWAGPTETLARIEAPAQLVNELGRHLIHPAVVDSVIQTAALGSLCRAFDAGDQSGLFLPYQVGRFQIHRPGYTGPLWCCAQGDDVFAVDDAGQPVITIEGLVVRRVQGSVRASAAVHPGNHYQWEWKPMPSPAPAGPRPEGTWVVVGDVQVSTPGPMRKAASVDQVPAGEKIAGLVHALPSAASACQWVNALASRFVSGAEVWLVTHGVYDAAPTLEGAPVWGFGRVLMSEQPGLKTTLVDLGPSIALGELWTPSAPEVRKDEAGFHAQSLIRAPAAPPRTVRIDVARTPYRAVIPTPGVLQSIVLEQQPPRALGPDDVEVSVRATCLNFKDVVVAMGMLPPTAWEHGLSAADLGTDCAGVVSAVGANVRNVKVGDEVVGCAPKCLGNRAVSHRHLWVPKPKGLSWEEAAAIPTVYFTAVIGLERLARLSPGETVLIHAGAGGVGIAAIHVAKKLGARIFATTSSPEKRAFLTSVGVEKIFNSRSADFRQDVMEATGGRGVDVVLNSLTGKALTQGIRCLAPFGRFVEIGKADLYANRQIGLEFFGENRAYHVLDVNRWVANKKEESGTDLTRILARVASGELGVLPMKVFPVAEAAQAVQALSQGKQIGKIVVSVPTEGTLEVRAPAALRFEGTQLITGGTQGFGLELARWLIDQGATHLVLASRRGEVATEALSALRATGAKVEVAACDVADRAAVDALVARLPQLRGVFHCAMVLDDAAIGQLDAARFAKVSAPKAGGAWNLHLATKDLDHFVLFSSIASVIGTPGQGNYAAANAFLDRLAEARKAEGKAATVINYGVLDAGVVRRAAAEQRKKILNQGVGAFSAEDALAALGQALLAGITTRVVAQVNWARMPPRFDGLGAKTAGGGDGSLKDELQALPVPEQAPFLAAKIAAHVAAIIGLEKPADTETGLGRFGLDSLMSVQLQGWLKDRAGVEVPLMRILRGPSIRELSEEVVSLAQRGGRAAAHAWLKQVQPVTAPRARLFCFSYMSGDGDSYERWAASLDPSIELWTVTYPELGGDRDALLRGPAEELRKAGGDALAGLTDLPYGFYGHSMGGWVALDLAKELESRGAPPRFVAVGALPTLETMRSIMPPAATNPEEISEEFVVGVMERMQVPAALLQQPGFRTQAVARTRRDLWLGMQNGFQKEDRPAPATASPVWIFGGSDDPVATIDKKGSGAFRPAGVVMVPGGHLFVEEEAARTQIATQLSGWLAGK